VKRGRTKTWAKGGKGWNDQVEDPTAASLASSSLFSSFTLPSFHLQHFHFYIVHLHLHTHRFHLHLLPSTLSYYAVHLQLRHPTRFAFLLATSSVSRTTVSIPDLGEPQTGARFPSHPSLSHFGADGSLLVWSNIHKDLALHPIIPDVSLKTVRQSLLLPSLSLTPFQHIFRLHNLSRMNRRSISLNSTFEFMLSYQILSQS
jgi:hypothetical protein